MADVPGAGGATPSVNVFDCGKAGLVGDEFGYVTWVYEVDAQLAAIPSPSSLLFLPPPGMDIGIPLGSPPSSLSELLSHASSQSSASFVTRPNEDMGAPLGMVGREDGRGNIDREGLRVSGLAECGRVGGWMGWVIVRMQPFREKRAAECAKYLKCGCHPMSRCRHVITCFRRHFALPRPPFNLLERSLFCHPIILFPQKPLDRSGETVSKPFDTTAVLVNPTVTCFVVVPSNLPPYSVSLIVRFHCHRQTMSYGKPLQKKPV